MGGGLYTTISSEKLVSKKSDLMGQIFQKILTQNFECISNLLYHDSLHDREIRSVQQYIMTHFMTEK
jgi:hypothetical protein